MPAATPKRTSKKRSWIRWTGTAISIGLFAWLLARQNWQIVWHNLSSLPVLVLCLALFLYFLGIVLNALRWQVILYASPIKIPFQEVVKIVFLGSFVSNCLPSTIGGDAVRIVSLMHYTEDKAVGFTSVVLDRIVNVAAMFTILPLSFVTFGSPFAVLKSLQSSSTHLFLSSFVFSKGSLPDRIRLRLIGMINQWREVFGIWFHQPWSLVLAFVISWFSVLVIFLAIYTLARGLGIPVALYQVMGVTAITYLVTLLPISVNGYGVREVTMTALYIYLGATIEQASTLAIVSRFFMLVVTMPGAFWFSTVFAETLQQQSTADNQLNEIETHDGTSTTANKSS